jgi:hypothetical protein
MGALILHAPSPPRHAATVGPADTSSCRASLDPPPNQLQVEFSLLLAILLSVPACSLNW